MHIHDIAYPAYVYRDRPTRPAQFNLEPEPEIFFSPHNE